jgi:hypothetical protein
MFVIGPKAKKALRFWGYVLCVLSSFRRRPQSSVEGPRLTPYRNSMLWKLFATISQRIHWIPAYAEMLHNSAAGQ